jgi:tetratricopeptide (TPR) repeat protein
MAKTRSFYPTGNEALDEYLQQLEAEPANQGLRMAIARMAIQADHTELGFHEYRQLIKDDAILDQVEDELLSLIDEIEEPVLLKRLHRCLGDCYSRQKRFREAMAEYNWTFNAS